MCSLEITNLSMRLQEANLSTLDAAAEWIKSGNTGMKVPQVLKDYIGPAGGIEDIENYLKKAEEYHADKTKTIQMALRVAIWSDDPVKNFHLWSTRELAPYLAKYSSAQWLKDNTLYKGLFEKGNVYTRHNYEDLRRLLADGSSTHGNAIKGSGHSNGVRLLYKDSDWILLSPTSFDAEKKIAFFKYNDTEEKCHWCTASSLEHYNKYTYTGSKPLYIIKNKEDFAWQIAFLPTDKHIEFLNAFNRKDEFTNGGWMSRLPIELQDKIVNTSNGKSFGDYTRYVQNPPSLTDENTFCIRYLPYIEISKVRKIETDFTDFMLESKLKGEIDSEYTYQARIKTSPRIYIPFSITEMGPRINHIERLEGLERRLVQLAILQYTAEKLELDIDYIDAFDKVYKELRAQE